MFLLSALLLPTLAQNPSHPGRKLALAFLLKLVSVKSFLYFAPSLAPPPQLSKLPYPCRLCQPSLFPSTVPLLYPNPKTFSKLRESSDKSYQNCTLQCSSFSSLKLSTATSQFSTSSGPDQITYPLLTHLPQSALHFFLYIFNLVNTHLPVCLEAMNNHPHSQTRKTFRLTFFI